MTFMEKLLLGVLAIVLVLGLIAIVLSVQAVIILFVYGLLAQSFVSLPPISFGTAVGIAVIANIIGGACGRTIGHKEGK